MRCAVLVLICVCFLGPIAPADVIVRYKAESQLTNTMAHNIDITYNISGDKNYIDRDTKISLLNMPGTPFNVTSEAIVRLDKGVRWSLIGNKSYTEETLKSLPDSSSPPVSYSWTYDVSPIGDTLKIKNFQCFGQIGRAIGVRDDYRIDTVLITFEQWLTADTLIGAELISYQEKFSQISGVHKMWSLEHIATYLREGYGQQFEKLSDLMEKQGCMSMKTGAKIEKTILYDGDEGQRQKMGKRPDDGGYWKLFSMENEIESLKIKKVDAKKFEIPSNRKKK